MSGVAVSLQKKKAPRGASWRSAGTFSSPSCHGEGTTSRTPSSFRTSSSVKIRSRPYTSKSFFFSSRRRHTRWPRAWRSDVCSSDLLELGDVEDVADDRQQLPRLRRHLAE